MATLDEMMQAMSGKPTAASRSREFDHQQFNPNVFGADALKEWLKGVKERTLHPLEALAKYSQDFQKMSPVDQGLQLTGGGLAGTFAGVGAKTANLAKLELAQKLKQAGEGNAFSLPAYKGFEILTEGKQFPIGQTAIKLKDGTVLTDNSPIHALQIKKLQDQGIPTSEIESGGFIRGDGSYIAGSADTPRIIEQDRARKAVEQKRSQRLSLSLPKTQYELAHELAQRNAALPAEQGGLGLLANNTAMERAKAMGFDTPAYHGTTSDFPSFQDNSRGVHFTTPDAEFANKFTVSGDGNVIEGSNVIPVLVNPRHAFDYQNKKDVSNLSSQMSFGKLAEDQIKRGDWARIEDRTTLDAIKKMGKGGAYLQEEGVKNLATFDPSQLRSRFAAFDPLKRNSPDLLASLLPITTTGLLANQLRQSLLAEPQPD